MEFYKKQKLIGKGSFSNVYRIRKNDQTFVLKQICYEILDSQDKDDIDIQINKTKSTYSEINMLKSIDHPNIIKFIEYFEDIDLKMIYIILEWNGDDITRYISKYNVRNYDSLMKQILLGVSYLHNNDIAHMDLKPGNITVKNDVVKIIDFNLSCKKKDINYDKTYQTLWYRAPEIIIGVDEYFTEPDVWSLGCIFYELLVGNVLFKEKNYKTQLYAYFKCLGTPKIEIYDNQDIKKIYNFFPQYTKINNYFLICGPYKELLEKMLTIDHKERISVNQTLSYF